jgi:type IV pilus assembly protein PilM
LAKKFIGIDIGSYNIKIANITIKKSSIEISSPTIIRTPRFLVQNGRIADKDELISLIKDAIPRKRVKSRKAIIILNDSIVITRNVELPKANFRDTEQMIRVDASEYLPFDVNEYTIRFKELLPATQNPKGLSYFMMSCVKNELVMDFYEVICKAGFKPTAIDTSVNGMIKYLERVLKPGSEKSIELNSIVMLDIGASTVKMVIVRDGVPQFQEIMNYNTQKIDIMIANALNIETQEAEQYKIRYGLDYLYGQADDEIARVISPIINSQIDSILNDVNKHINNFMNRNGSMNVYEIWLSGGVANMKGLSRYIKDVFSISCKIIAEDKKVRFSDEEKVEHVYDRESFLSMFTNFANISGATFRGD